MKLARIVFFILVLGICGLASAQEDKTKGLDVVTDTAVTVIKKADAFFNGRLEWTMSGDTNPYRNSYTVNAMGQRTPRSTLGKFDSGQR